MESIYSHCHSLSIVYFIIATFKNPQIGRFVLEFRKLKVEQYLNRTTKCDHYTTNLSATQPISRFLLCILTSWQFSLLLIARSNIIIKSLKIDRLVGRQLGRLSQLSSNSYKERVTRPELCSFHSRQTMNNRQTKMKIQITSPSFRDNVFISSKLSLQNNMAVSQNVLS